MHAFQPETVMLTPEITYTVLLIAQALHLLHHRLAKRHISFVEVVAGGVLCIPVSVGLPVLLMAAHLILAIIQVVGSLFIARLSPTHDGRTPWASHG